MSEFFTENRGQAADGIRYYLRGNPTVSFRDDGIEVLILPEVDLDVPRGSGPSSFVIEFQGGNRVRPAGIGELAMRSNFFLGSDPSRWATQVPSYQGVLYENLYDGIDAFFSTSTSGVKYEFRLRAGADPATIVMTYDGASPTLARDGGLTILTASGDLRDSAPIATQGEIEVPCTFVTRGAQSIGFACSGVDASRGLVIDPLLYSTYFGEACQNLGMRVAHDGAGHPIVVGWTDCAVPTTPGAYDTSFGGAYDVFITKFDTVGPGILFSTFLGGDGGEYARRVETDPAGNIYLAGETYSVDFPTTPGAFDRQQSSPSSFDGYIAKLDATGSSLLYSTFVGNGCEHVHGLAVDVLGFAYITGDTCGFNFPVTPGAFDTNGGNGFVVKMNLDASALVYGTFLGNGTTTGFDMEVDDLGNAYVVGYTLDNNFPVTPGAFDTTHNSYYSDPNGTSVSPDVFMTKLNPTGTALVYSTFVGGNSYEWGMSIDIDEAGNAYATGTTASTNFPTTPGVVQPGGIRSDEAFVVKLNPSGSDLVYGTYLAGYESDYAFGIEVDALGNAFVTGYTSSSDFPISSDAYDASYNGGTLGDAFLAVLGPLGDWYVYSTYLGGTGSDMGIGLTLDGGTVFIAGSTYSIDFPITPNAFDGVGDLMGDGFVVKLSVPSPQPLPDLVVGPSEIGFDPVGPVLFGTPVTITATVRNVGDMNASQVRVRAYDGQPPGAPQIGSDQVLGFIPAFGGSGLISVGWTATLPPGPHEICIAADPDQAIVERVESNNVACKGLVVDVPPPTTSMGVGAPTYTSADGTVCITSFTSLTMIPVDRGGTGIRSTKIRIDVGPWFDYTGPFTLSSEGDRLVEWYSEDNYGNAEGPQSARLRVDDTPPASFASIGDPKYLVGGTFVTSITPIGLAALDGGATPVGVAFIEYRIDARAWTTYAGSFAVTGDGAHVIEHRSLDWLGNTELAQNLPIVVDDTPPVSSVAVGDPKSLVGSSTFVTSATPFNLLAADGAVGTDTIEYRVDGGPWVTFTTAFTIAGEGPHVLEFRGLDRLGNAERSATRELIVDDTPPSSTLIVGEPKHLSGRTFITSATPLSLAAVDGGAIPSGVDAVEYRIDGGPWVPYSVSFALTGEGPHALEFRARDRLGNTEAFTSADVIVDDTPPAASIAAGTPTFEDGGIFVSSATLLTLGGSDEGPIPVGLSTIEYRVGMEPWTLYAEPFGLTGPDGTRAIEYRSTDRLGNEEATRILLVTLDNAPPVTLLSLQTGDVPAGTPFVLEATDAASGVAHSEYKVGDGEWTRYEGPVVLDEGGHVVRYRSRDRLGNLEPEKVREVHIAAFRTPVRENYEPLVAAALAFVLTLAGIASSRRADLVVRGSRLKLFLLTSVPFVGGEVATGVASLFTTSLSIPPVGGLATAFNVSLLAAGLVAAWAGARSLRPAPTIGGTSED